MKFQLLFFIVLAIVATFFTTGTEAAPKKQHGEKHFINAPDIKLWSKQLRHVLQNGKRHEQKMPRNGNLNTSAIENPALLQLLNYLTWLDDLVIEYYVFDIIELVEGQLLTLLNFGDYFDEALRSVGVDMDALAVDYFTSFEEDYFGIWADALVFWKSWVDDPEHIRENLLVYIPKVQHYLQAYSTSTLGYFMTLVNLSQTLLTPPALEQLRAEVQIALDAAAVTIDIIKASLKPPTEIVPPPTNVTLEVVLGFFPYVAELNVSSIILDGLSTAKQLKELRLTFDKDLVTLFGEASGDGADSDSDLESQGRNLTERFEAVVENRYVLNRLAWDYFLYANIYVGGWEALGALEELLNACIDAFYEIVPLSIQTIAQLVGLVETLSPEYQQRASELVTQALQNADTLIQSYLEVFKPKEMKN